MSFVVKDMPAQLDAHLVKRLAKCETATIGHVKQMGFVDRGIQAPTHRANGPKHIRRHNAGGQEREQHHDPN